MICRTLFISLFSLSMFAQVATHGPAASTQRPAATTPASGAILMFAPWHDPKEDAFTLNVPQGWQVSGGTVRDSAMDPRHVVRAVSPDGIQILLSDPTLIPRETPNPMFSYGGIREGQVIRGAWGGPLLVARYQGGEQFAQSYIRGTLCRQPQISSSSTLADATRQLNQQAMAYGRAVGAPTQASVGEASFHCGAQVGYVRASTVVGGPPNGAQVWGVLELSGFVVTDASKASFARYVLNNVVSSLQMNPEWLARQAQLTHDVTGSVTRSQQQMAGVIAQHAREEARSNQIDVMSGWEKNNKVHDAAMQNGSDARRGTMTASDPIQGDRTVSNQYNYVWTRPDGSIAGTNTTTPPDYSSGWRMMQTSH
ncbi:MAG TPA: hypothetical protein VFB79_06435 [Candidatus Angelobacter sp.]|nr:hypothetical protein [Candidatus Angelobacter sp.]